MGVTGAEDGGVGVRSVGICGVVGGMEDCFIEVEGRGMDLQGHAMVPSSLGSFGYKGGWHIPQFATSPF